VRSTRAQYTPAKPDGERVDPFTGFHRFDQGVVFMTLPAEKSPSVEAVSQAIIDLVRAEVGPVDLTADSTLESRGMDSLKIMSLVFKIEARYDIQLEEGDADEIQTVADLARLVVRRIQERS
jgi:acyl carrier protein